MIGHIKDLLYDLYLSNGYMEIEHEDHIHISI